MKQNKNGSPSFTTLLTGNYIIFTAVIALAAALLFYLSAFLSSDEFKMSREINEYSELLSAGKYDRVPFSTAFPEDTNVEIYNSRLELVWSNMEEKSPGYTSAELACMPEYHYFIFVSEEEYETPGNVRCSLVTRYYNNAAYSDPEDEFFLLDVTDGADVWMLYGSADIGRYVLTQSELSYLVQSERDGRFYSKLEFASANGERMVMVVGENADTMYVSSYDIYTNIGIGIFVALYILAAAVSIVRIDHKVKKPLGILESALQEFADGARGEAIKYSGPREFENICESFNRMSKRIEMGEEQRRRMEEDKRRMLADISHDLRTPITVIQGYAGALRDGMVPKEREQEYLQAICRKSQIMTELVNTFYEYSKTDSPDFRLAKEKTDMCEYMREYLADKYTELDMAGFTLDVDIPYIPVRCMIDRVQFRRAVENLITNAVRHNQDGAALFLSVRDGGDVATVTVADNGEGVPDDIAATLFDPFVMGDDSRSSRGGSGLGLAICRKIVEAHGGSIRLVEPPALGCGAEFEITVPKVK